MAEEFHAAGICGGTWWNIPSKTMFSAGCTSPCSMGISDMGISCFGWGTTTADMVDIKARSYDHQEAHHHHQQEADSDDCGSSILIDSTLQMMGFGLSSSTASDWNQSLLSTRSNGRTESYNSILQEDIKSYTGPGDEDSSITTTTFKPINNNQDFPISSSGNTTPSAGFPMGSSASYGYPIPTLLPNLFEPDDQQQQQSLFNNRSSINYMSATATATYEANANELLSPTSWPKLHSSLHFSNNTPYWNASATATGVNDVKAGFLPSPTQSQFLQQTFEEKPNCPGLTTKTNTKEVRNSGSMIKKGSNIEPPFKRPRIETPSPLPTFKVRKEKLGDRITALQQLVSPFGKTDTASVLHEAIEYIKFLHDQVNVLSTPYMKQAAASIQQQQQQQQSSDKLKEADQGPKQDLRSRGLCLVPMSSTFPVANETTADFWTPTFGGTFR